MEFVKYMRGISIPLLINEVRLTLTKRTAIENSKQTIRELKSANQKSINLLFSNFTVGQILL